MIKEKFVNCAQELKSMFNDSQLDFDSDKASQLLTDLVIYHNQQIEDLNRLTDSLYKALISYTKIDRCENPIEKNLPNPEGYAKNVELFNCGKCKYCLALKAISDKEKML